MDLCIKPSGRHEKDNRPWALVLRDHGPVETTYSVVAYMTDEMARHVAQSRGPYWLFGEPDWDDRERKRELERARVLKEQAAAIEAANS